jgi:hypothetical protein
MLSTGIQPNAVSYTSLINAAKLDGSPRAVELGYQVYLEMPPKARNVRTVSRPKPSQSLRGLDYP